MGTSDTVCPSCEKPVVSWETECLHCGAEFPDGPVTLEDEGEEGSETRSRTVEASLDRILATLRDVYATHPTVAAVGGVSALALSVLLVLYALTTSLLGTAVAVLAWAALTVVLAREGVTYRVVERSVLAAALFLPTFATVVRLTTKTALVAKANETPTTIHASAATLLLVVVGAFSVWAVRTTPASQ